MNHTKMPVGEIPFTTEALKANLSRLENEWENYQTTRDRGGIYGYLTAVFELVTWWKHEHKAQEYARRALSMQRRQLVPKIAEPFAAVIFCTADPEKVDYRMRSKCHGFYATRRCTRIWMNRYGILSSARAVSTNVRLDIPVALGEVRVEEIKWPRISCQIPG